MSVSIPPARSDNLQLQGTQYSFSHPQQNADKPTVLYIAMDISQDMKNQYSFPLSY